MKDELFALSDLQLQAGLVNMYSLLPVIQGIQFWRSAAPRISARSEGPSLDHKRNLS